MIYNKLFSKIAIYFRKFIQKHTIIGPFKNFFVI